MFSNLSWYEIVIVLLVALFIFGDKLPRAISDGLRMLRNLRRMARSATADLSRELGTDIELEDLHPKTFLRKHVLSEADQDALVRPLKGVSRDLTDQTRGLEREFKDLGRRGRAATEDVRRAADLGGSTDRTATHPSAADGSAQAGKGPRSAARDTPPAAPAPRARYDDVT